MRELEPMPTEDEIETLDEEGDSLLQPEINESVEWPRVGEVNSLSDGGSSHGDLSDETDGDGELSNANGQYL